VVGSYQVFDGEQRLVSRPLVALADVPAGGWWVRWSDALRLFIKHWLESFDAG
jgi:D-alanyl-D-alanine carboxypeptidase (penicillin-binding protein 5/6)